MHPDRPAVCFVGDGSFQMALHALPVAAEHRLGVTWVVLDDQALGSIRDIQQHRFDERILATEFGFQPDFAALARACGCHGERVDDAGDVDAAVARALEANARRRARPCSTSSSRASACAARWSTTRSIPRARSCTAA